MRSCIFIIFKALVKNYPAHIQNYPTDESQMKSYLLRFKFERILLFQLHSLFDFDSLDLDL